MFQLDNSLFLLLNAGPTPDPTIAGLAILATKFLILLIPVYIFGLWLRGGNRNRLTALGLVGALVIAIALSSIVGLAIFRPRPFMIGLGNTLVEHRPNSSFPSNHGLVFATCAILLFLVRRNWAAWVATGLGIIVAWSRIYVGVHYPLDMLGSLIIAVPAAMASLWLIDRRGAWILGIAEHIQRKILKPFSRI